MNELPKHHKITTICKWKSRGLIYDNFDILYQHYIDCKSCEWCGKVFETNRDRNLDHDHETGAFRLVVCHRCNTRDSYIKYPKGYTEEDAKKNKKKYNKEYFEKNRDKYSEKYLCECGTTLAKSSKSKHERSIKHTIRSILY